MILFWFDDGMEKIEIGKAVAAHGIRGGLKILNWSEDPCRFSKLRGMYVGEEFYEIEHAGHPGKTVIVKLKGIDDRNAAQKLCGRTCGISEEYLEPLPPDTYYVRDIIGLDVTDYDMGRKIGTVRDVMQNGFQDIYIIDFGRRALLVPAVKEFVKHVDMDKRSVTIKFIRGMIEE